MAIFSFLQSDSSVTRHKATQLLPADYTSCFCLELWSIYVHKEIVPNQSSIEGSETLVYIRTRTRFLLAETELVCVFTTPQSRKPHQDPKKIWVMNAT